MYKKIKKAVSKLLVSCGAQLRLHTLDRDVLEKTILPYFAQDPQFQRILFIGCDWYTRAYSRLFAGKEYWTLEMKPSRRKFGAVLHITDRCQNTARYFDPSSLDVIVMNGVFGYGLNEREDVEQTLAGFHCCLRDQGIFVLGWNDVSSCRPMPLEDIEGLRRFEPYAFPPLGSAHYLTPTHNRHTFSFYRKPLAP